MALRLSGGARTAVTAGGTSSSVNCPGRPPAPRSSHLTTFNGSLRLTKCPNLIVQTRQRPVSAVTPPVACATSVCRCRRAVSAAATTAATVSAAAVPYACWVSSYAALAGKQVNLSQRGTERLRLLCRRSPVRRSPGRSAVAVAVSANLFSRLFRIITSFFNGLVDSFEDPEKLLDRVAEEMQEDMVRMRQATAQVMASQRQLISKQKSLQASADQWLARAELAVGRGQDDLAREALKRRKVLQEDADRLNEQVVLQTNALEQLQANTRVLEGKLNEARSKKETLKARAASARTSLALQEMIGGLRIRSGTSWAAFEKMEEKVAQLEAQSQTAQALVAPDSLERQFAALEGDTGVDAELAALKQQTQIQTQRGTPKSLSPPSASSLSSPPPPLTGRPLRDVFDPLEKELEDLRRRARE